MLPSVASVWRWLHQMPWTPPASRATELQSVRVGTSQGGADEDHCRGPGQERLSKLNEHIRQLREIPGIGLLTATALYASVGDITAAAAGADSSNSTMT